MFYSIALSFLRIVLRIVFAMLGGVRVEGVENIPQSGAVLIAPNHLSHADGLLMGLVLSRPCWYMVTDELFTIPVLGRLARFMHAFPVKQDSPDRAALRRAEHLLNAGEGLVMFPEGHESLDGTLQPLLPGSILVAMHSNALVVPVGIIGTDRIMPPRGFRLHRVHNPAVIRFGRPLSVQELTGGLKGRAALDYGVNRLTVAVQETLDDIGSASSTQRDRCAPRRQS